MELWKNFDRLVVFDTETTGIEFGRDRIIEDVYKRQRLCRSSFVSVLSFKLAAV